MPPVWPVAANLLRGMPEFATSDWGAVVTGLLTPRGLLTGERESFRAVVWAAVVTVGVTTGPQALSREPEKSGAPPETRETLCHVWDMSKPRALSLSGFSANRKDAESPLT